MIVLGVDCTSDSPSGEEELKVMAEVVQKMIMQGMALPLRKMMIFAHYCGTLISIIKSIIVIERRVSN
jgi:hypothetical protein